MAKICKSLENFQKLETFLQCFFDLFMIANANRLFNSIDFASLRSLINLTISFIILWPKLLVDSQDIDNQKKPSKVG